jgi:hypothetical protein
MTPRMPGGRLFGAWFAFVALLALGLLSFAGWLAYLLVMHFTHGGAS